MGNTCCKFSWLTDLECVVNHDGRECQQVVCDSESFPNHLHFIGQPNVSVQCLENPEGEDGIVVFDYESCPIQHIIQPNVSVQCLENPEGEDGIVVFDYESCPIQHIIQPNCVVNRDGRERQQVVCDSESFRNYLHFIDQPNVSVQCLENPEGEDGIVVFDYESCPIQHIVQPNVSVQCLENPEGEDGIVMFDYESCPIQHIIQPNVPVQCLENPEGEDGVMLIANESFPI